jgi:hypothetical protein
MNIDEVDAPSFRAAVVFLWALSNRNFKQGDIILATEYPSNQIAEFILNWTDSGVLKDGIVYADLEDEATNWMEFILIAMCGAGEIHRTFVKRNPIESISPFMAKNYGLARKIIDTARPLKIEMV